MKVIIDPHTHLVVELRSGEVLYEHLPEEATTLSSQEFIAKLHAGEQVLNYKSVKVYGNK